MPTKAFPILGFQPDLSPDTPGVIVDSSAVLPTDRGIGNGALATLTGATFGASRPYGGAELFKIDGTSRAFIGTSTKLHELVAGVATDRSSGTYAATAIDQWSFAQMGDISLAVNKQNVLQQSATGAFANIAGAPKASILTVAGPPNRSFVMLFDYDDGTNNYQDGAFWSPSYTTWTPSIASQIGNIRLTDINGKFTAACAYRDGVVVFKSNAMYVGQYVGGADQWDFQRVSSTVGCAGPQAVCAAGDMLFFADSFGLWQFDGSYPRAMPGAIHNWWTAHRSYTLPQEIRLTWDKQNHRVWVRYSDDGFGAGMHAVYNLRSQLWTHYQGLDSIAHLLSPNYAAVFAGGVSQFASVQMTGTPDAPGTVRFGAFGSVYGETLLRGIRPQFLKGPSDTATGWLSGNVYRGPSLRNIGTPVAMAVSPPGRLDAAVSDRFVQPEFTVAGGNTWECAQIGVDAVFVDEGE